MEQPHESVCSLYPPNPTEAATTTPRAERDRASAPPLRSDLELSLDEYALAIQTVQVERILQRCESSGEKPSERDLAVLSRYKGLMESLAKRIDAVAVDRKPVKAQSRRSKSKPAPKRSASAKTEEKHEESSNG